MQTFARRLCKSQEIRREGLELEQSSVPPCWAPGEQPLCAGKGHDVLAWHEPRRSPGVLPCPPPALPASSQSRRPASKTREEPRYRGCARPAPTAAGTRCSPRGWARTRQSLSLLQTSRGVRCFAPPVPCRYPSTRTAIYPGGNQPLSQLGCCGADWSSAPSVLCACEGSWWCPAGTFPKTPHSYICTFFT